MAQEDTQVNNGIINVLIAGGLGVGVEPPSCLLNPPPNKMPWDTLGVSFNPPPPRRC
jgi:hypothetical protein